MVSKLSKKQISILISILEARDSEIRLGRTEVIDIENKSFIDCVIRNFYEINRCSATEEEVLEILNNEDYFKKSSPSSSLLDPTQKSFALYYNCK